MADGSRHAGSQRWESQKLKKALLEMLQLVVDRVCDELEEKHMANVAVALAKRKRSIRSAPPAKQQARGPQLGAEKSKPVAASEQWDPSLGVESAALPASAARARAEQVGS